MARVAMGNSLEERSISERVEGLAVWRAVAEEVGAMGVGAGQYSAYLVERYDGREGWWYQPVHNGWLVLVVEYGVVGVLVMAALAIWLLRGYVRGVSAAGWWMLGLGVLALMDHWPMTLHQGRAAWFVALIALIWWHNHLSDTKKLDYNPK